MERSHISGGARCTIVGADKLVPKSKGNTAICETIKRAIASRGVADNYSVVVRVLSASRLTAAVVVDGHPLPEQRFAVMDRDLGPDSLQHFADSLAQVIVEAQRKTSWNR